MIVSSSTAPSRPVSSPTPPAHGRFVWHELLARDPSKAIAFYPAVCGWTVSAMSVPEGAGTYTMFNKGDAGQGGLTAYPADKLAAGALATWMPYLGTDDADATCREAISLGGTLHMSPTDTPTVGRIAVLADPEGVQFAIIAPARNGQQETVPGSGEFAWHEMLATDPVAAFDFYSRLFGWEKTDAMDMGSSGIYQMFGRGAFTYGGFMRRSPETQRAMWNCYVRVDDLDASCAAIEGNGGRIVMGPHPVPNDERIVLAVDDQGALFSLVSKITR